MEQDRQYPVLRAGSGANARIDWENRAILFVLQASVGLIGPEVLGVSVEAKKDEVIVHICFVRRTRQWTRILTI